MDFVAAARHLAAGYDDDPMGMSLDPTMQDAKGVGNDPSPGSIPPKSDGQDPATPGGAAPYNGSEPFGQPVTTDEMWLDPQKNKPAPYSPMPHVFGPDEDKTTLHNARRASYERKSNR